MSNHESDNAWNEKRFAGITRPYSKEIGRAHV